METEPLKVEAQPQPESEKKVVKKIIKKTLLWIIFFKIDAPTEGIEPSTTRLKV